MTVMINEITVKRFKKNGTMLYHVKGATSSATLIHFI